MNNTKPTPEEKILLDLKSKLPGHMHQHLDSAKTVGELKTLIPSRYHGAVDQAEKELLALGQQSADGEDMETDPALLDSDDGRGDMDMPPKEEPTPAEAPIVVVPEDAAVVTDIAPKVEELESDSNDVPAIPPASHSKTTGPGKTQKPSAKNDNKKKSA